MQKFNRRDWRVGPYKNGPAPQFEQLLHYGQICAILAMGLIAVLIALSLAQVVMAPIAAGVVLGLMFGPLASRIEALGLTPPLAAAVVMLLVLGLLTVLSAAFYAPLAAWIERAPQVWESVQSALSGLREPLNDLSALRENLRGALDPGKSTMVVSVDQTDEIQQLVIFAPAALGQLLLFLGSFYFFLATRASIRVFILSLCLSKIARWRAARILRDAEAFVSRYVLAITAINLGLGVATTIAMTLIGAPSPILWGALAALLNYVLYLGPAAMIAILTLVGLASFDTISMGLLPPLTFLALNLVEAQFVTPTVVGKAMTLNPFLVFCSLAFWLWLWGPIGAFLAIPILLICYCFMVHMRPRPDR